MEKSPEAYLPASIPSTQEHPGNEKYMHQPDRGTPPNSGRLAEGQCMKWLDPHIISFSARLQVKACTLLRQSSSGHREASCSWWVREYQNMGTRRSPEQRLWLLIPYRLSLQESLFSQRRLSIWAVALADESSLLTPPGSQCSVDALESTFKSLITATSTK